MNDIFRASSARATTQAADGIPRLRWSVEEFEYLSETGFFTDKDRIELIGGELVPMSPKGNRHEVVRGELSFWLVRNLPQNLKAYIEPGWRPDQFNYLEPDILVFPATHALANLAGKDVTLLIEISDSSLPSDLHTKSKIYAGLSVAEYWVVNAKTLETRVHREPGASGYATFQDHPAGKMLVPLMLPQLSLSLGSFKFD